MPVATADIARKMSCSELLIPEKGSKDVPMIENTAPDQMPYLLFINNRHLSFTAPPVTRTITRTIKDALKRESSVLWGSVWLMKRALLKTTYTQQRLKAKPTILVVNASCLKVLNRAAATDLDGSSFFFPPTAHPPCAYQNRSPSSKASLTA